MFLPLEELSLGILGALIETVTSEAPAALSSPIALALISSATSGAEDVTSTSTETLVPSILIFLTKPNVTISLENPGYVTYDSVSFTICSVIL